MHQGGASARTRAARPHPQSHRKHHRADEPTTMVRTHRAVARLPCDANWLHFTPRCFAPRVPQRPVHGPSRFNNAPDRATGPWVARGKTRGGVNAAHHRPSPSHPPKWCTALVHTHMARLARCHARVTPRTPRPGAPHWEEWDLIMGRSAPRAPSTSESARAGPRNRPKPSAVDSHKHMNAFTLEMMTCAERVPCGGAPLLVQRTSSIAFKTVRS